MGTCPAHRLISMQRTPNLYSAPREVVTLDVDIAPEEGLKVDVAPEQEEVPTQRVLLLEDRDDFRDVLRDHLSFRKFRVTLAPSGVEGLLAIRENAFDIILCDMMMPRMGGEMFYWAVTRSRPAYCQAIHFLHRPPKQCRSRVFL